MIKTSREENRTGCLFLYFKKAFCYFSCTHESRGMEDHESSHNAFYRCPTDCSRCERCCRSSTCIRGFEYRPLGTLWHLGQPLSSPRGSQSTGSNLQWKPAKEHIVVIQQISEKIPFYKLTTHGSVSVLLAQVSISGSRGPATFLHVAT